MPESLFRKPDILVIEDEPTQRHILTNQLISQGYEVVSASNGRDGLALWEKHPEIRLVVTDLAMPEVDGVEVVKTIRSKEHHYTVSVKTTASFNQYRMMSYCGRLEHQPRRPPP